MHSNSTSSGVRRPTLYAIVAAFGVALAIPLALSSGQTNVGGIFDECFGAACEASTLLAKAD